MNHNYEINYNILKKKNEISKYTNTMYMTESKSEEVCEECGKMYEGEECNECSGMKYEYENIEESIKLKSKSKQIHESIEKTLDMFRRFGNK